MMNISNNNKNNTTREDGTDISSGTSTYGCKDGSSTKSTNDDVCEIDMIQNMSTADNENNVTSACANCGKEGANNVCNKCKQVKYCNAVCKKVHKKKHKKDCEEHVRLAAEHAARLHEEKLFKQPPPEFGDCPICFLRLPTLGTGSKYQSCCGKLICSGCVYAPVYDNQGNKVDNKKCPLCRTPHPKTDEEIVERVKKRMEVNDAAAFLSLGWDYSRGKYGLPQDHTKALELCHRAGELGYAKAYTSIGSSYYLGKGGVKVDKKKAMHYWELAAIGGDVSARHNLGVVEVERGNVKSALKHYMIAVKGGHSKSLDQIKALYSNGFATKEDYMKALQAYQEYLVEIKSPQRDEAAAAKDEYRYY